MDAATFVLLVGACAPRVDALTARALVQVESAFNPHAIGVVGGQLARQPRSASEAVATASGLQAGGRSFSVGLAQINDGNFARLGLTAETALEPCSNLQAMQTLLLDCYQRARQTDMSDQRALRKALSCYYSGNFTTGFDHGYTRRVVAAANRPAARPRTPPRFAKDAS